MPFHEWRSPSDRVKHIGTMQDDTAQDHEITGYGTGPAGKRHLRFRDTSQSSNRDEEQLEHHESPSMWHPYMPGPSGYGYGYGSYGEGGYQGHQFHGVYPRPIYVDAQNQHDMPLGRNEYFSQRYAYTSNREQYRSGKKNGCVLSATVTLLRAQGRKDLDIEKIAKDIQYDDDGAYHFPIPEALARQKSHPYEYPGKEISIKDLHNRIHTSGLPAISTIEADGEPQHSVVVDKIETDSDGDPTFVCLLERGQSYKVSIEEWHKAWVRGDNVVPILSESTSSSESEPESDTSSDHGGYSSRPEREASPDHGGYSSRPERDTLSEDARKRLEQRWEALSECARRELKKIHQDQSKKYNRERGRQYQEFKPYLSWLSAHGHI